MYPNTYFCLNLSITFTVEKRSRKIRANTVIFIQLPKVNNDPIGENSHNLGPML
jgi:hypothetical protein